MDFRNEQERGVKRGVAGMPPQIVDGLPRDRHRDAGKDPFIMSRPQSTLSAGRSIARIHVLGLDNDQPTPVIIKVISIRSLENRRAPL